ncbi:hypothetical protein EVAR_86373_1 [Eumeta japonica]|uniref:Reverse transcriptase domain-containing protein n=1 Tax=Eumeta variegata TaxID=151549 RepID=A0A4C1W7V4_EUMVA|nr:hypothetical protein EVAR_86373_1 [Eumeta japonica]
MGGASPTNENKIVFPRGTERRGRPGRLIRAAARTRKEGMQVAGAGLRSRGSSAYVGISRAYTDWFVIRRGVRQGYVPSLWLCHLIMDSSCVYDLK